MGWLPSWLGGSSSSTSSNTNAESPTNLNAANTKALLEFLENQHNEKEKHAEQLTPLQRLQTEDNELRNAISSESPATLPEVSRNTGKLQAELTPAEMETIKRELDRRLAARLAAEHIDPSYNMQKRMPPNPRELIMEEKKRPVWQSVAMGSAMAACGVAFLRRGIYLHHFGRGADSKKSLLFLIGGFGCLGGALIPAYEVFTDRAFYMFEGKNPS